MLGTLIQGRISVGGAAISATKSALAIAVRHGLRRRQFGPPDSDVEVPLLDYRVHQRRLLPALARTYALHFAQQGVVAELDRIFGADDGSRRAERGRAAGAARARDPRRRAQGARDLARDRDDPGLPRGLRRRRLSERQPVRRAEGRHRRLHHLRGRQHDPAAAGGEVAADRLPRRVRRAEPDRDRRASSRRRSGRRWSSAPAAREIIQRLTDDLVPGRERDEDLLDREYHLGPLPLARGAHPLRGRATAEARHRRRRRAVRRLQRLPGPRARHRPRPHRARDPRGVRGRGRALRGPAS